MIDSNGYFIWNNDPLLHDPTPSSPADGGLTKLGSGELDLTTGIYTYTGPTLVSAGVLSVASTAQLPGWNNAPNTVSVAPGAVLAVQVGALRLERQPDRHPVRPAPVGPPARHSASIRPLAMPLIPATSACPAGFRSTSWGPTLLTMTGANTWPGGLFVTPARFPSPPRPRCPYYRQLSVATTRTARLQHARLGQRRAGATLAVTLGDGVSSGWSNTEIGNLLTSGSWAAGACFGIDTSNASAIYTGNVAGAMGLTKLGGNLLTMTGNNSYTGPTAISGGTLQFSSAANQTLSGNVSGGGALVTTGPGTLTLSGSNSYSGGTTIPAAAKVILRTRPRQSNPTRRSSSPSWAAAR